MSLHQTVQTCVQQRILADVHGRALVKGELFLWGDVHRVDMQHFLSHCPNLVDLSLTSGGDPISLINDADMRKLPVWRPRIAKLELIECGDAIADASFSYALERGSASAITAINVQGCSFLTDAVLPVL